jgi:LacI family transcriptional regulator
LGITIKDIAAEANVSTTTVSRVINNKPDVSESTKEKIKKIMETHNYKPNKIARGLVMKKTKTIGLIIPDISNPFFPEIIKGVENKAKQLGYSVIICDTDNQIMEEITSIDLLLSQQVDGMITALSTDVIDEFNNSNLDNFPIVQLDRNIPQLDYPTVSINNKLSAYKAGQHLINLGHKSIVHVTGELKTKTAQDRLFGFKEVLRANNIEINEENIIKGDFSRESGFNAFVKMLERGLSSAVFFANDLMAIGAYEAADKYNISIPEDISIIGHDGISFSEVVKPRLTTMVQPKKELGEIAAELLINIIKKNAKEPKDVILTAELIRRQSTRKNT